MAEPIRRFAGDKTGAVVQVLRAENLNAEPRFYFACWECGACSKHSTDEAHVITQALEHLEDHES